jgi:hypothetical protein
MTAATGGARAASKKSDKTPPRKRKPADAEVETPTSAGAAKPPAGIEQLRKFAQNDKGQCFWTVWSPEPKTLHLILTSGKPLAFFMRVLACSALHS